MSKLANATVLITGGTGSFGEVVLQRLLSSGCRELRVLSRDEKKQFDMQIKYAGMPVTFWIGDVRDRSSLSSVMRGVDYVFHAAALKQVPTGEFFPQQVVSTNVLGSANVMDAAVASKVKNVVCLSTDKAVMPVSAMGMSKALMEKHLLAMVRTKADADTILSLVRYGNVMCSRGSVIPLFISQIKAGNPISITDDNMSRFMLPLHDAVELVLYALTHAKSGDLFIKKSPACSIRQLANVLMKIFNKKVPIKHIGVRLGEKIHETLATASEIARAEDRGEFLRIPIDQGNLGYERYYFKGTAQATDFDSSNTHLLTDQELESLLLTLPFVQSELSNEWQGAA